MQQNPDRREFLYGGVSLLAAFAGQDLNGLLGARLPEPLRALVPPEALGVAGLIGDLLKLEAEAKRLRLPPSPLSLHEGQAVVAPDQLYRLAMPRLVALIDRAEWRSPRLAEKAAGLLAKLHRSEHDLPDMWFESGGQAPPPAAASSSPSASILGAGIKLLRPPRIAAPLGIDEDTTPQLPDPAAPPAPAPLPTETALPPISTSIKFDALADEYAAWFAAARIRDEFEESTDWHLTMMRQSRPRYERVGKRMGVPWYFIAAIHGLEASFNFRGHLHNGDFPLTQRTRQVPANRPPTWLPPSDWDSSAADALRLMGFAGQNDWSMPRCLHRLEAYNGFGYRRSGRVSPYLWSYSTHYIRGKFVADGRFDPRARSKQCGAAVMLKLLDLAGELG